MKKIQVACLPVAGDKNPYQHLMMKGLQESNRLNVMAGCTGKVFPLLRTALKYRPDYIHLDWIHQYYLRKCTFLFYLQFILFVLDVFMVRYFFRIKLIWTLHNIIPHDQSFSGLLKWPRIFFASNCYRIRVFSSHTIKNATKTLKVDPAKFIVIPEGSYVNHYRNEIDRSTARKKIGISDKNLVYLYLGFIKPYKGLINLINSFNKRVNKDKTVLLIAGEVKNKKYFKELESISDNNVIFKPKFIPDDDLQLFFNSADLVILPFNRVENSGSAILAMGFKKAILAPKIGVLPTRLQQQIELLYDDSIDDGLDSVWNKSAEALRELGLRNFESLKKYSWSDFQKCFK